MLARERAPSFSERSGLVLTELLKTLKNVNKQAVDHEYMTAVAAENVSQLDAGLVDVNGHSDEVELRVSRSQNEKGSDSVISVDKQEFLESNLVNVASVSERISIFGEKVQPRKSIVIEESVSNQAGGSPYTDSFALPPLPPIPPPDLPPGVVMNGLNIPPPPPPPPASFPSPVRMVDHTFARSSHESFSNDQRQKLLPARTTARENVFSELSSVLKTRFPIHNDGDDVVEIKDKKHTDSAPEHVQEIDYSKNLKSGIQNRKSSQGRVYENVIALKKNVRSKIESSVNREEASPVKYEYHPYENFQIKSKRDINKNMNNVNLSLLHGLDVEIIDRVSDKMRSSSVKENTISASSNKGTSNLSKPVIAHNMSKSSSVKNLPSTNATHVQEKRSQKIGSIHPVLNDKIVNNVVTKASPSVPDIQVKEAPLSKDTGGDKNNNSPRNLNGQEPVLKVSDLIQNFQGKKDDINQISASPQRQSDKLAKSTDHKTPYDGLSTERPGPYIPDKVYVNIVELDSVTSGSGLAYLDRENQNTITKQDVLNGEIGLLSEVSVEKGRTNLEVSEKYDAGTHDTAHLDDVGSSVYSNLYDIQERPKSSLQEDESETGELHSLDRFVTSGTKLTQEASEDIISCQIETGSVLTASYGTFKDDLIVTSSLRGEDTDRYSLTDVTSIQSDLSEPFIEEDILLPSERIQRIIELLNDANNDVITWRTASEDDDERDDNNVDEITTTELNKYTEQNENVNASTNATQSKGFRGVEPQPDVVSHSLELYHSALSPNSDQPGGLGLLAEATDDDGEAVQKVKTDNADDDANEDEAQGLMDSHSKQDEKVLHAHLPVVTPVADANTPPVAEHSHISLDTSEFDKADSLSLHSNHSLCSNNSIHSRHSNSSVPIHSQKPSISEHLHSQSIVSNHSEHSIASRSSTHSVKSHHSNNSEVIGSDEQAVPLASILTNGIHQGNDNNEMENVIIFHQIPNLSNRDKITLGLNGTLADAIVKEETETLHAELIDHAIKPAAPEISSTLESNHPQPDDLISVSTMDFDDVYAGGNSGTLQSIGTSIDDEAELADAYLKDADADFDTMKLVKEGRGYLKGQADADQMPEDNTFSQKTSTTEFKTYSETMVSTTVWNEKPDTKHEYVLDSKDENAAPSTRLANEDPQSKTEADFVNVALLVQQAENDSTLRTQHTEHSSTLTTQQPENNSGLVTQQHENDIIVGQHDHIDGKVSEFNLPKTVIVTDESASATVTSVASDDAPKRLSTMTEAAIATGMLDNIVRDMYLSDSDSEVFSPTSKTFTTEAEVHAAGIISDGIDVTTLGNNMSQALDNDDKSDDFLDNRSEKEGQGNGTNVGQEDYEVLPKSVRFEEVAMQKEKQDQNSPDYTELNQGVIDFSMELSEGDEEVKDLNIKSLALGHDGITNVSSPQETISHLVTITDGMEAGSRRHFEAHVTKHETLQNDSHQSIFHNDLPSTSRPVSGHMDIEKDDSQLVSEHAEVKVNSLVKSWELIKDPHAEQITVEAKQDRSTAQSTNQSVSVMHKEDSNGHNAHWETTVTYHDPQTHPERYTDGNSGHKIVSKQSSLVMVPDDEGKIAVNQGQTNGYLHTTGEGAGGKRRDSLSRRRSRDDPDVIFDNASLLRRRFRSPDSHHTDFDHLDTIVIEKIDDLHAYNNKGIEQNSIVSKPNLVYERKSTLKTSSKFSTRDDLTREEDLPKQPAFIQQINVRDHQAISPRSSSNGTASTSSDLNEHATQKKDQVILYMPGPQSFKHVLQLQNKHISPPGGLNVSAYSQEKVDIVNVDITVPRLNNESTRFQSNEQFKSDVMRFRSISPKPRNNGSNLSNSYYVSRETGEPVYAIVNKSERNIKVHSDSAELTFRNNVSNLSNVTVTLPYAGETRIKVSPRTTLSGTGSPLVIDVDEGRMPSAYGDGLYKAEEGTAAVFYVDAQGLRGELSVQVDGPNSIAKCNVDPDNDGTYAVTYVPVEVGMYNIQVRWNNKEIQGSPFHPKIVDGRQVHVIGGWQHYMDNKERVHVIVNEEKHLPFDVKDAGPGNLTAEVRGPSGKIPVHIEAAGDNKRTVTFTATEEGDYYIYVYWSDHAIVGSPFHAYARFRRVEPDPTKVILSGRGLTEARVTEKAEFVIDGTEAGQGKPDVRLQNVHGTTIPVQIAAISTGRFRCTYTAEDSGSYLLYINWNNRQLRGSPFKVNILPSHHPEKVIVTGEGLQGGVMGKDINVVIDTRRAGPGELTAHCMGPHKVAYCELEDMRDGTYRLNIRPQEPGRHILQIKYGGHHVLGSPYVLKIAAQPDASKVRVSGPGVEHGMLAMYQSRFMVETRGAGAGQLTVRIRGPKGAFQVEMMRDSQKDRTILCQFHPTECGLYVIYIKWSGMDVPGSPFSIHIVDSVQEYNRIMSEGLSYNNQQLNRSGYGSGYGSWREEM